MRPHSSRRDDSPEQGGRRPAATVTILDGAKATAFIDTANGLQSDQVFDGDTIAVIGLTKEDTVQVTIFKDGCRTYQSRNLTHAEWAAIIKAVSDAQSPPSKQL